MKRSVKSRIIFQEYRSPVFKGEMQTEALAFGLHSELVENPLSEKSGGLTSGPLLTSDPRQVTYLPGP